MIISDSKLYGIDVQIYRLQYYLEGKLSKCWAGSRKIYGRAIETERDGAKVLEVKQGKEYKQLFINDRESVIAGVKVNNRSINNHRLTAEIDIIFTVNVKECLGLYDDEKALMQAYSIVANSGLIQNITNINIGIDNVFSGYETERIKHRDMMPFHVFSFTTNIEYFENLCQ